MASTITLEGRPPTLFKPTNLNRKQTKLITLEEHAVTPFPIPGPSSTFSLFNASFLSGLQDRLGNLALRLQIMDANNIGAQIISLNQPTAQAFTNLQDSIQFCQQANRYIFETYCTPHPDRFFGFATLPTQDGHAAAVELERCVTEYGFVGAMVNGFTATDDPDQGLYLDDPQFDALWEVAQRMQKPIFIHPRVPLESNMRVLKDMPALHGAPYGFARETVEHVLRLMYSGVFDRFPSLKGPKKKLFQQYFQDNIVCNTSGMPRTSALINLLAETKVENVMFSVDYPYESIAEMREWFETVPVADETWKDIGYRNAIALFKLPLDYD
ncbi:hypothetical protein FE257_001330 [Aspergillus nanangensis]|uniref:Amidohydrolase-related domain-containing protein n=1 Tax=Aspergillus nanangensis TaxID=2582783 RepID=A0AAD4CDY1_ASPNN|nr:hypothetical protein FE257_001330 [Aspergillus nanangensis]